MRDREGNEGERPGLVGSKSETSELPAFNPRNLDAGSVAKVDCCSIDTEFLHCGPKVELISRTTALEALIGVLVGVDGESSRAC